ncbi:MAG TPA: DNA methyltransferase [Candidatus Elarobacter sp.]|jgi:site-specific DNA-methyltransferase (cytosine-N4-specific)|nr:DNA methyltransferase [Candidatus Elarobacter sp.]
MSLAILHGAHPYFAKFHYQLPLKYIERYTKQGDTVFDPFCGSGTTLIAANSIGRNAIGIDANPLACLIARVKASRYEQADFDELQGLLETSVAIADRMRGRQTLFSSTRAMPLADEPAIPNCTYWFEPEVLHDLRGIKGLVAQLRRPLCRDAARVAFSRIIVRASNQQGESQYRRVDKGHERGVCWDFFVAALSDVLDTLRSSQQTLCTVATAVVHNEDCRVFSLPVATCDLIVTSPPYLNSWDYSLYQKFRMLWLDFNPKAYSEIEIGNHLRTLRNGAREVERYRADMRLVFANIAKSLKRNCYCVFVNGETVVSGEIINTDDIITEAACSAGMLLRSTKSRPILGPHYGNHASMGARRVVSKIVRDKAESILVYQLSGN